MQLSRPSVDRQQMPKKKLKPGDFFSIPLPSGGFAFGREIGFSLTAFYALRAKEIPPLSEITKAPLAFTIVVDRMPFRKNIWEIVGALPLEARFKTPPFFFRQDAINKRLFRWDVRDDSEKEISLKDCEGLECMAVWSSNHATERLEDFFNGRANEWVESMKPKMVEPSTHRLNGV